MKTIDIIDVVIMALIEARPSAMKVNDLAEVMKISRQSISKRVNDLATLRYINHAGTTNTITEKGAAYLRSLPIQIQFKGDAANG